MQITVEKLLESDFFVDSTLAGGQEGLNNIVYSLNVLEHERGYAYLEKGMLVITSGYFLASGREEAEKVIERLAARKVAGLAMKPTFFEGSVPQRFKEAADAARLPLIVLGRDDQPFRDFFTFFESHIYARGIDLLMDRNDASVMLTQSMHGDGIAGLSSQLHRLTKRNVVIQMEREIYHFPERDGVFETPSAENLKNTKGKSPAWMKGLLRVSKPVQALGGQIFFKEHLVGTVWIEQGDQDFDENDAVLLRAAVLACELDVQQLFIFKDNARKLKDHVIRRLLKGRIENLSELVLLSRGINWKIPSRVRVVALGCPGILSFERKLEEALAEFSRKEKLMLQTQMMESQMILLLPDDLSLWRDVLPRLMARLRELFPKKKMTCGVGNNVSILDASESYGQACYALKAGTMVGLESELFVFEDMGIYRLISRVGSTDELPRLCHELLTPLIEEDIGSKLNLIETLRTYFRTGCNLTQTGKELYIHYNTVRYRLSVVEKLCGISLSDYEERLALENAIALMPLLYNDKN